MKLLPTDALVLHPDAALVPQMPKDQYEVFLKDVKARGILVPIELVPGTVTVIEGRTRLRAAKDAGIQMVPTVPADAGQISRDGETVYMIRAAFLRRQLTSGQRAALAVELEKQKAKLARQRKKEGQQKGAEATRQKHAEGFPEKISGKPSSTRKDRAGEAREEAGKEAGVSGRYVSEAKRIEAKSPEVFAQLKSGEISLPQAVQAIKPPAPTVEVDGKPFEQIDPMAAAPGKSFHTGQPFAPCDLHELKPCPFCGSGSVALLDAMRHYSVSCHNCGAQGPSLSNASRARAAWNLRQKK